MTCGIYKLVFSDCTTYIGKSNNIERRWHEHLLALSVGNHSAKLQAKYKQCGYPICELVLACHEDFLSIMETYFVTKFKPALNTSPTLAVSEEELAFYADNLDVVSKPSYHLIKEIIKLRSQVMVLETTELAAALKINRKLVEDLVCYRKQIRTLKNRTFWQWLFG